MVWVMNTKMVLGVVSEVMEAMMDIMTTMDLDILGEDLEVMGTTTTLVQGNVLKKYDFQNVFSNISKESLKLLDIIPALNYPFKT